MPLNKAYIRNLSNEEFLNVVDLRNVDARPTRTTTYEDVTYLLAACAQRLRNRTHCGSEGVALHGGDYSALEQRLVPSQGTVTGRFHSTAPAFEELPKGGS